MSKKVIIELMLKGFNGASDATDDHILTVLAPEVPGVGHQGQLKAFQLDLDGGGVRDLVKDMSVLQIDPAIADINFNLPDEMEALLVNIRQIAGQDSTKSQQQSKPLCFAGRMKSISDDDLCASCLHCNYQPGDMSGCSENWPGVEDDDGYVQKCEQFALAT